MNLFDAFGRAADLISRGLGQFNLKRPNRITVTFPTLDGMYAVRRQIEHDWDWGCAVPTNPNAPMQFFRDSAGFICFDVTFFNIPFRFTTSERTCGFPPTLHVDGLPQQGTPNKEATPLITAVFDPATHYIARHDAFSRSDEPGVKRAG